MNIYEGDGFNLNKSSSSLLGMQSAPEGSAGGGSGRGWEMNISHLSETTGKTEPKGSRGRIWRKALQESCEHTRGLVLGFQRAQSSAGLCRGSEMVPAGRLLVGL